MTSTWAVLPLGEVCDVLDSQRIPITKRDRSAGEYPYYGASGVLGYVDGYLFDEQLVLVGEDGAKWGPGESTAFIVEGKVWVNNHAHVLRPNRGLVLDEWLVYFLNHADLMGFISGLTVPKLNQASMRAVPVLLPPVLEQQRIVAILDEAFEGISLAKANAKANVQNAGHLLETEIESVFAQGGLGWTTERLGDITTKIGSGATPRGGRDTYSSVGTPLIRSMNVHDRGFRESGLAFIDDDQAAKLLSVSVQPGDVLLNITGASVARCCVSPEAMKGARVNQHVSIIRAKPDVIDARLLHYILTSKSYKDRLLGIGAEGGSTRQAITKAQIAAFEVTHPRELDEQLELVSRIDDLCGAARRLQSVYLHKLTALNGLMRSLLNEAFAGNL